MAATNIFFRATSDAAVVYWDLPADAASGVLYTIFQDGTPVGSTMKTHFTLAPLQPNSAYAVAVCAAGRPLAQITVATAARRRRLDVTAAPYRAVGDGQTMNTAALQRAFDNCGAGEEVYFPAGVYLTGALDLHSDMAVYLDEGAVVQGSADPADYTPRIWSRFEGVEQLCYRSLLNAGQLDHTAGPNCQNILLYGKGTVSGGGRTLAERMIEDEREALKEYLAANPALVASCENERTIPGRVRGRLVNLSNCAHVHISGLTLQNGPSWNVHMVYCDDIVTDHCTFRSAGIWNGDGWDPDSSENCTLFAALFETADDSVAIKSGKNPEGNAIGRPARHIRVFDCRSRGGHGLCIGSEMSGGVEDVQIWGCDIAASTNGFEVKGTPKRGGYVRDVTVRDCTFPRVLIHAVAYNDDGEAAPDAPVFENFRLERVRLTGIRQTAFSFESESEGVAPEEPVTPVEIHGFAAPGHEVRRVLLKDCTLPAAPLAVTRCLDFCIEGSGSPSDP